MGRRTRDGDDGSHGRDALPHRPDLAELRRQLGDKLYQRLGWQPRCKPTVLPSGRIVLPLYSDTYSAGLMALSFVIPWEDTLTLMHSDHGEMLGDHGLFAKTAAALWLTAVSII